MKPLLLFFGGAASNAHSSDFCCQIEPPIVWKESTEPAAASSQHRLPLHLVGLVAVPEAERGGEVAAEELLLLDGGEDALIDGLLVRSTGAGDLLLLQDGHRLALGLVGD